MAAAQVRSAFGDVSLYEVLGVPKTADAAAIKKGFYRKSLSYHPDKDPSPGAKDRFQALCFVHSVLSDPDKRSEYDRTVRSRPINTSVKQMIHSIESSVHW